ncbi:MAG: hypothetical protein N3A69_11120 [Leptospiraceae bacterium]|nr:hypothetical protein [Leptospiraceae bacterium]
MKFEKRTSITGVDKLVYEVKGEMDKVLAAVSLFIRDSEFSSIEFYSSFYGVASVDFQKQTLLTRMWESEEVAQEVSALNYHYTGKILNGFANEEMLIKIISDCFAHITELSVKKRILEILQENNLGNLLEFLAI